MTYNILKLLHIVAVIVWLGGGTTILLLSRRIAAGGDGAALRTWLNQSAVSHRIFGIAAATTLITGFAITGMYKIGFPIWVIWGIGAMIASMAIGAIFLRKATQAVHTAIDQGGDWRTPWRRMITMAAISELILLSAVAAMVLKWR